jgi:hypothetical protein
VFSIDLIVFNRCGYFSTCSLGFEEEMFCSGVYNKIGLVSSYYDEELNEAI